jgi:ATP-dependent helicase/DNAse subunit B
MSLQLPLYLYAVEQLLAQHQGRSLQPAGGIYYQIRNPIALKLGLGSAEYEADLDAGPRKSLQPSNDELRKVIDASIHRVNSYIEDMTKGKFPLTSHDSIEKVCTYCDYKTICRIQTVRRLEKAKTDNG